MRRSILAPGLRGGGVEATTRNSREKSDASPHNFQDILGRAGVERGRWCVVCSRAFLTCRLVGRPLEHEPSRTPGLPSGEGSKCSIFQPLSAARGDALLWHRLRPARDRGTCLTGNGTIHVPSLPSISVAAYWRRGGEAELGTRLPEGCAAPTQPGRFTRAKAGGGMEAVVAGSSGGRSGRTARARDEADAGKNSGQLNGRSGCGGGGSTSDTARRRSKAECARRMAAQDGRSGRGRPWIARGAGILGKLRRPSR